MSNRLLSRGTYQNAEEVRQKLREALRLNLKPPPKLTGSQWAEANMVLSPENSAEPGKWKPWPFQPAIMDAITDPRWERVTIMKSARVGYTQMMMNCFGFYVEQFPSPMLMVMPTFEAADDHSATHVDPMLRDVPRLGNLLIREAGNKKSGDNKRRKMFRNGASLRLTGAGSPNSFRRITVRGVFFDEVDDYEFDVGGEGSPITLGIKRTETFWPRFIVIGSTPTIAGQSHIEHEFLQSDQRRFHIPCPECGTLQWLQWGGKEKPYGLKPDSKGVVYYCCKGCGHAIPEHRKKKLMEDSANGAGWISCPVEESHPQPGHAGFHLSTLYSLSPNATWQKLWAEFKQADTYAREGDTRDLKTFVNTTLGETWVEQQDDRPSASELAARRSGFEKLVPDGVKFITCGVDVQGDGKSAARLELEIVGWGEGYTSWQIAYHVIPGGLDMLEVQQQLLDILFADYDGRKIAVTCIDHGGGYGTEVLALSRKYRKQNLYAIKGASETGFTRIDQRLPIVPPTKKMPESGIIQIGTQVAKDRIARWLTKSPDEPGYMNVDPARCPDYWWKQVAESERRMTQKRGPFTVSRWEQYRQRPNEALDCRIYALAAMELAIIRGARLNEDPELTNRPKLKKRKKISGGAR